MYAHARPHVRSQFLLHSLLQLSRFVSAPLSDTPNRPVNFFYFFQTPGLLIHSPAAAAAAAAAAAVATWSHRAWCEIQAPRYSVPRSPSQPQKCTCARMYMHTCTCTRACTYAHTNTCCMTPGIGKEILCRANTDCCFGIMMVEGLLAACREAQSPWRIVQVCARARGQIEHMVVIVYRQSHTRCECTCEGVRE